MKKAALKISLIVLITLTIMSFSASAAAAVPGDFTLGINAGYPYLLTELELEYKGARGRAAPTWHGLETEWR